MLGLLWLGSGGLVIETVLCCGEKVCGELFVGLCP